MSDPEGVPPGASDNRHLRASLARREAELARVHQIAGVGGLEVDLRAGFRNRRSPEYLRIHGLPPEAAQETHEDWVRRIHPDDRDAIVRHFVAAVEGGARDYRAEYRIVRPSDGQVRWIAAVAEIERDETGVPTRLIGAHRDVTERKCAEIALRESEVQKRLALEAAQLGIWEFRPVTGALIWDARCKALFGLPPDAPVAYATFLAGCHPDDRARMDAAVAAATDPSGSGRVVEEYRTIGLADGVERWIVTQGQATFEAGLCVRFIGVVMDITDRKRAEAALRESRDRLDVERHALEVLNRTGTRIAAELDLGRLVQTVVDAGVELTSARFGAFFYNTADEQGGKYMLYALSGAERSAFEALGMPRATAVFAPTFRGEGVVRSNDILRDPRYGRNAPHAGMPRGHLAVRSYLAVPVVSRSGDVIGGLFFGHPEPDVFDARVEAMMTGLAAQAAIGIDNARLFQVTQQANATLEQRVEARTAELQRTEEALRQAQKMEAVGQLTGGIAHDFNNLLTGISGSLELLQTRMGQGRLADVDRYVAAAQGAAKRAAALTHRLLAFSRRQTLDPRTTDVNRLVAGMEELIRRTVGPAIAVEVVGAPDLWPALVDPNQLENALLNLCINARDAMPDGGRMTVETANRRLDAHAARMSELPPGPYLSLCVTDTGTGMTPEVIARAFDPFFTTKPTGQGTGLGLSMIYGFARQSGGQVRITSEVGRGTTVCIVLPRHDGEAEDADPALVSAGAPRAGQGETVLVVDDEPTVRMLVAEVLEGLGYTAIEAADSLAGMKLLQSDARIDLLITDVGLPGGMNGRQMADAARIGRPDLRVLFITGYAENAAVGNGHLGPGMQVLTKPFVMDALASRIKDLLARTEPARA
ncbi:Sensor histidine kinase RcsC [Methylobacterium crusticola]|uniref:histidine kinase n=1 Tax=Methylobacterium crusticola TaxID=1697972 RepID=A0ABQ4R7D8_9HYPH|nr:PAS domain-containing protein [Methylobacterium crusticola]GJD53327.1 Sensor histidine kinase RcsC [Methylobacterium crusticola]